MSASTLTSWAQLIWQELQARQLDADHIFHEAGLDPVKLSNAVARYPVTSMQKLWNLAEQHCGESFGVNAGNRWNPTTFHALGFAWLASASLGEALFRISRYGKFLNDGVTYELLAEKLLYRFRLSLNHESVGIDIANISPLGSDATVTAVLKMLRMLLGEGFSPVQIICPHPPNSASLLLEQQAQCSIQYGGDAVEFVFERHDVERKLHTGNAELTMANEQIIAKHIAELDRDQLSTKVEMAIIQQLPSGNIKEGNIANALHLSSRTLQRRLAEEGTSFKQLLQETRQKLADQYIAEQNLAISEVAYLLGFSEQANFTRAFKRWHGVSPSDYRNKACA